MSWLRRSRRSEPDPGDAYARRRRELLAELPAAAAEGEPPPSPRFVMETTYEWLEERNCVLVAVSAAAGATACLASGAELAPGSRARRVAGCTEALLRTVADSLDVIPARPPPDAPPAPGRVLLCVQTADGTHAIELPEEELGLGGHQLSPLFYDAHRVFAELRLAWLAAHAGHDVTDDYGPLRWSQRAVPPPAEAPMNADDVFARLENDGVREAVISFEGGNDEGGAGSVTFVRTDGAATDEPMWSDGREAFGEALAAPIYDQVGTFAGPFLTHGTLTWNVPERSITMKDAVRGDNDADYDENGEYVPRD